MSFFKFFNKEEDSKTLAKERLKLVLVHDRADMSPNFLDEIKEDIINAIEGHAEIDRDSLDLKLTRMKDDENGKPVSALVANIPITKIK